MAMLFANPRRRVFSRRGPNNNDNMNREIGVDRRGLRLQAGCHTDCVDKQ